MATTAVAKQDPDAYRAIASTAHTAVVLVIVAILAYLGTRTSKEMRSLQDVNRIALYGRTIITEWTLVAIVIWGVWRKGTSLGEIFGRSWKSVADFVRDIAIAAGFWISSALVLSIVRSLLQPLKSGRSVAFLLPQTTEERVGWVLLSITAGICEEALHRGYFQRQFTAATRSVAAGVLLAGVVFGITHSYQGIEGAIVTGLSGTLLGAMAVWRKSLRPGMLAHAWSDVFAGVIAGLLKIRVA